MRADGGPGGSYTDDWYFENVVYFAEPGAPTEVSPGERWRGWWRLLADRATDPAHDLARRQPEVSLAAKQGFVLTTAQASELGFSRAQTRTRLASGVWTSPRAGVIAPIDLRGKPTDIGADPWVIERRRHALSATAAALCNPTQVISGRSAAVLHGLPTFEGMSRPVLTVSPSTTDGQRCAVHARKAGLRRSEVTDWFGALVTTIARTLVDLARHDRRDGLLAADAALHENVLSRAEIEVALERASGWPGVRAARAVLQLATSLAESPLESLVRLALHDSGFPAPTLQAEIAVPGRRRPYRVDFLWPQQRLILEADGRGKYTNDELWREKQRENALRMLGYRVERVVWGDIVHRWSTTHALLAAAFG